MAGDWIKMRVGLVNHPKVLALSEALSLNDSYQEWSGLHGFVPSIGGTQKDFDDGVTQALRVTRYVTVTALLRFWGYANEHAKEDFIASLRISDIDEISGIPGFGTALEEIGWAVYEEEMRGVFLPNFSEHNATASDRGAADRQKRYREKKKTLLEQASSNGDVTRDVTALHREEKRREEKNECLPPTEVGKTGKPVCPPCPIAEIISVYHETLPTNPRFQVRNEARDGYIRSRWKQFFAAGDFTTKEQGIDCFRWLFAERVKPSKFLTGQADGRNGSKPFAADLEWLMRPTNFAKVIEGKYL